LGFAQSAGLEASARFAGRSATVTPGENANRTDVLLIGTGLAGLAAIPRRRRPAAEQ
jgi:hypothetical protein